MIEMIKTLCFLSGISGREDEVRNYIISKIEGFCEYKVDNLGNIIAYKKGRNPAKNKVLIDAHMDEVGFIVTGVDKSGLVKFANVGGVDTKVFLGRSVTIGKTRIPGVFGIKPIHLTDKDKEDIIPSSDELYIDIGAASREEALEAVSPGDDICFEKDFVEFGDGFICSKAIDDRAGCAIMIDLIRSELEYDCIFSFSVQEEIGTRGAAASAFTAAPDYAIVVETTTAADICGTEGEDRVCVCGEGGAVSFMDRSTVYNPDLYKRALDIAREKGIKAQTKTRVAGGNDAGAIHKSRGGVKVVTVSVPTRYLHSPGCVCKYEDILSSRDLIKALAEDMAQC